MSALMSHALTWAHTATAFVPESHYRSFYHDLCQCNDYVSSVWQTRPSVFFVPRGLSSLFLYFTFPGTYKVSPQC